MTYCLPTFQNLTRHRTHLPVDSMLRHQVHSVQASDLRRSTSNWFLWLNHHSITYNVQRQTAVISFSFHFKTGSNQ